ncbi:MAG: GTPase-activating protein [Phylliscum demangeonii]|nr:MAG: GTPase-activating protein [Phylliscum demangeonii]
MDGTAQLASTAAGPAAGIDRLIEKPAASRPSTTAEVSSDEDEKTHLQTEAESKTKTKTKTPADGVQAIDKLDSRILTVKATPEEALERLPPHERDILKRQIDVPVSKVNYFTLYRYASTSDLLVILLSSICAVIGGSAMPLMTIVYGQLTGTFQSFFQGHTDRAAFNHYLSRYTLYFVYLAIGEFVTIYVATAGWIYVGEHVAQAIRERYLAAILRQNVAFFDKLGAGEITTRITADTSQVQDGISEKVGLTMSAVTSFLVAFIIAFIKSWKLAFILTASIVFLLVFMAVGGNFMVKYNKKSIEAYAQGGTIVEEVLSSIRNATAFGTQEKLARKYDVHLREAERWGRRTRLVLSVMLAGMLGSINLSYSLGFWQGSRFLVKDEISLAAIVTTLLAVIIGAFTLGNVAPNAQALATSVAAAAKIFSTIDRRSPLDPSADEGERLEHVAGVVELRHVKHIYPSRPEVVVMEDVSLVVPAGKTTALVGASGSGKSTIVGLVERFYDPVGGDIFLDGHNIRTLNLRWLRQQMALVSQEPTLFGTTIYENIRHGLIGTRAEGAGAKEQRELVIDAAKFANAHDFVSALPEGYETNVGERGFLLSGGQKQRIAIARAIVGDPKILLLDEATSALDTKSEGVVQDALDRASRNRTTIVIAHRLSTIKTADNIVVMSDGRLVEQGTHDALLDRRGAYFRLVQAQEIAAELEEATAVADASATGLDRTASAEKAALAADPDDVHLPDKLHRIQSAKSVVSDVRLNGLGETHTHYSLWTLGRLVLSFNRREWPWMLLGFFCAIIGGGGQPTQAVFFSKAITALSLPPPYYRQLRQQVNFWAAMYLMVAGVSFLAYLGQYSLGYCAEKLIRRARERAFRTILRQDIAYFDQDEHAAGALTTYLSTQTLHLAGLSGVTLATIMSVTTILVASLAVSLAVGWKLALVCAATIPVLLACGYFRFWLLARFQQRAKTAYEASASYACEATSAVRTVASLTREEDVWQQYHGALVAQARRSLISVLKSSLLYAASQSIVFLCVALGFWYGGRLIGEREYGMTQFFIVFSAVIFGSQSAGTIFSFAPDMGKAKQAAQELKELFDRRPAIDAWSEAGQPVAQVAGQIEFRDVHFRYPTRPDQPVLRGLNLSVQPGQYVALVGASGCGKSTTIALLERFYDPTAGAIFVDGREISTLRLDEYRRHLALVSQEPTLYQGTIRENILLGVDGADDTVPEEAIVRACKDANIYDFIMSLPDGFHTAAGSKGTMLSGGQKQRIAIARALIRDPKILLLDEASSALDSESEKIVQGALDRAAHGRTTIAVAHRLSTIQKADVIYVFDQGRIVERGTHRELLARRGRYFEMVNLQTLGKTR